MVKASVRSLHRFPVSSTLRSVFRRDASSSQQAPRLTSSTSIRSIKPPTSSLAGDLYYPMIEKCPSPTCECAEMPADLDIDHEKPLRGKMPYYTRHIVIRTGESDWESRIEDGGIDQGEEKPVNLARELKGLIGPKGKYYDPHKAILVSNTTLKSRGRTQGRDVLVFPEGYSVPNVGETPESLEAFVEQVLMPSNVNPTDVDRSGAVHIQHSRTKPRVFICGHNNRDRRCGVLGPLLQQEFLVRARQHATVDRESEPSDSTAASELQRTNGTHEAEDPHILSNAEDRVREPFGVGLISHIGGHSWAGNVIIYLPPDFRLVDGTISPLAGKGVWYGRVEPRHVEGIVEETIRRGRLIEELLRGVHSGDDVS